MWRWYDDIRKTTTIRLSWAFNITIYYNINILPIPSIQYVYTVHCAVQAWVGLVYCYGPWHFWSRQEFECLWVRPVPVGCQRRVTCLCVIPWLWKNPLAVLVGSSYPRSHARPSFIACSMEKWGEPGISASCDLPICDPMTLEESTSCNCMYVWVAVHRSWPSQDSGGVLVLHQCVSHRHHLKEKSRKRHLQMMVCSMYVYKYLAVIHGHGGVALRTSYCLWHTLYFLLLVT